MTARIETNSDTTGDQASIMALTTIADIFSDRHSEKRPGYPNPRHALDAFRAVLGKAPYTF